MSTRRTNSAQEVANELRTAITTQWATSLTEGAGDWGNEGLRTPATNDIRIGHVPVWDNALALSIIAVGNSDTVQFLGAARVRTWSFDIAIFFPATDTDDVNSSKVDHYLQVLWMSLRDYNYCANAIIIDIVEEARYSEIRNRSPYIDPGVTGGILQITATCQYLV